MKIFASIAGNPGLYHKQPEIIGKVFSYFDGFEVVAEVEIDIRRLKNFPIQYSVHAPFFDLNIASLDKELRRRSVEAMKKSALFARELDAKVMIIHPGTCWDLKLRRDSLISCKNSLKEMEKIGLEYGLELALENMSPRINNIGSKLYEILSLIEGLNIGICLDFGHAFMAGELEDKKLGEVRKYIKEVHLHDNHGDTDEHLPIGKGEVPFKEYTDLIRDKRAVLECRSIEDLEYSRNSLIGLMR